MSDKSAIELLHRALELGVNFYDTSHNYRYGESEKLLGKAFNGKREKVILVTKVGKINPSQKLY